MAIALGTAFGHGEAPAPDRPHRERIIFGEGTNLRGGRVVTWALLSRSGKIEEVGITVPRAIIAHPPEPGDGPSGAFASLKFPKVVREATYFNHFEMQFLLEGHPVDPGAADPNRYAVPHFDVHFYSVPEAVVFGIPEVLPPNPFPLVSAQLLPAGYLQPGPSVPEMGRHAEPVIVLTETGPFRADMIAGFLPSGSAMHFIEPMFNRETLLQEEDISLPVPRPEIFGRRMLYPESFAAEYDAKLKAWHFVFRHFVLVE